MGSLEEHGSEVRRSFIKNRFYEDESIFNYQFEGPFQFSSRIPLIYIYDSRLYDCTSEKVNLNDGDEQFSFSC